MKHSSKLYRTIKGVRFEQLTSNPALFAALKKEAKDRGLKCRVINKTELIVEVSKNTTN